MNQNKEKCLNILRGRLDSLFETNDWNVKRGVLRAAGDMLDEVNCKPSPVRAKALNDLLTRCFGDAGNHAN